MSLSNKRIPVLCLLCVFAVSASPDYTGFFEKITLYNRPKCCTTALKTPGLSKRSALEWKLTGNTVYTYTSASYNEEKKEWNRDYTLESKDTIIYGNNGYDFVRKKSCLQNGMVKLGSIDSVF